MKTVHINASKHYEVKIGRGLLDTVGQEAAALLHGRRAVVVSDTNVAPRYLQRVLDSLHTAGFSVQSIVFQAGEASKNTDTFVSLVNAFAAAGLTRSDAAFALGGGVVGDATGFAAACYLRGIDYIQIPTSLLAMTDSSVGGKTAVDLPSGKNLCGAFHQPSLVLCDLDTLSTLPADFFADGMAEVIKYGAIRDAALFETLCTKDIQSVLEDVVARCVQLKRDVVQADEFDRGVRQLLNFGHTMGHAVEQASNFNISHGRAVAIGMVLASKAAGQAEIAQEIRVCCERYGLNTECPYDTQTLLPGCLHDKKTSGTVIQVVEPQEMGHCVTRAIPTEQLADWIMRGVGK